MRKEAEEWLRIAEEELQSAEYLFEKQLYRMVCYHSQQAVEKTLKSLLVENEVDVPRTHNILDLRNAVKRLGFNISLSDEETIFLNAIYRARYPSDLGLLPTGAPTHEDAKKALDSAREIIGKQKNLNNQ
jgi:HEPN domain-containing protein